LIAGRALASQSSLSLALGFLSRLHGGLLTGRFILLCYFILHQIDRVSLKLLSY